MYTYYFFRPAGKQVALKVSRILMTTPSHNTKRWLLIQKWVKVSRILMMTPNHNTERWLLIQRWVTPLFFLDINTITLTNKKNFFQRFYNYVLIHEKNHIWWVIHAHILQGTGSVEHLKVTDDDSQSQYKEMATNTEVSPPLFLLTILIQSHWLSKWNVFRDSIIIHVHILFLQVSRGTGSVENLKEPDDDPQSQYKDGMYIVIITQF